MTYEKAANALVEAGLLNSDQVSQAVAVLSAPSVDMTYPGWAEAMVRAGLIDGANLEAATDVMEKAGKTEADDDSQGFEDSLENAGIL